MLLSSLTFNYMKDVKLYCSGGTLDFTKQHAKELLRELGDFDSSRLSHDKVVDYIYYLRKKGNSNSTINKKIDLLRRIYKFNKLSLTPFCDIHKLKEPFITFGLLDSNIPYDIIFKGVSPKNRLIILLFRDTGIRLNELLHIRCKNVDLTRRCIYLETTKTNHPRFVYFTESTAHVLRSYLSTVSGSLLFPGSSVSSIECLFSRIRSHYGLKNISPHRFRHSFSTNLYLKGCDLLYISRVLGHSSVETTKRYIHSSIDYDLIKYDRFTAK